MKFNNHPQLKSNVRSFFAVVAISIALPALAYADHDHDKDGPREDHGRGDRDERQGDRQVPVVPEANAGWVLVPFSVRSSFSRRDSSCVGRLPNRIVAEL